MSTTPQVLSDWFDEGVRQSATHMIVVCDTFDHGDFPVYVKPDEDAHEKTEKERNGSMQRVVEVYDLRADKVAQMAEDRAFNFGDDELAPSNPDVEVKALDPENYGFEAMMEHEDGEGYWTRMKGVKTYAEAGRITEAQEREHNVTCLVIQRWTRKVLTAAPAEPMTLCCNVKMMGLGGDPERAVVCWNPDNGVVSCCACGTIYVDSKDVNDYDRWKAVGGGMVQERHGRQPKFGVSDRVTGAGEQTGRVQDVTYRGDSFRYLVKWDLGPTTPHDEAELHPATLPPQYP